MRLVCSVGPCVLVTFAFSLYRWLALSENEAECVSLHCQYIAPLQTSPMKCLLVAKHVN
ncbi:hypothetical protein DPMN_194018 [Dreissena polymorpha]|uniref:Secreted protein n=1 Tax=Dreissena polymorpha TaxID=45954 RepID=A0A9D3Y0H8_DREPO|nr:hypothetical protein DPMN_194018 [Dreissena polymorpha]